MFCAHMRSLELARKVNSPSHVAGIPLATSPLRDFFIPFLYFCFFVIFFYVLFVCFINSQTLSFSFCILFCPRSLFLCSFFSNLLALFLTLPVTSLLSPMSFSLTLLSPLVHAFLQRWLQWSAPPAQPPRALAAYVVTRSREGLHLPPLFLVTIPLFVRCVIWERKGLILFCDCNGPSPPRYEPLYSYYVCYEREVFLLLVFSSLSIFCTRRSFLWERLGPGCPTYAPCCFPHTSHYSLLFLSPLSLCLCFSPFHSFFSSFSLSLFFIFFFLSFYISSWFLFLVCSLLLFFLFFFLQGNPCACMGPISSCWLSLRVCTVTVAFMCGPPSTPPPAGPVVVHPLSVFSVLFFVSLSFFFLFFLHITFSLVFSLFSFASLASHHQPHSLSTSLLRGSCSYVGGKYYPDMLRKISHILLSTPLSLPPTPHSLTLSVVGLVCSLSSPSSFSISCFSFFPCYEF